MVAMVMLIAVCCMQVDYMPFDPVTKRTEGTIIVSLFEQPQPSCALARYLQLVLS